MHTKDLRGDDGGDRKGVKDVDEGLPDLDVAASLAFIVETVHACDVRALVVTAQQEEVLGVPQLVAKQKEQSLKGLLATIDVVTEEEVITVWREAAHFEHADEICVLSVDVANDLHWRCKFEQCGLGEEDLTCCVADGCDLGVLETEGFCRFACVSKLVN